MGYPPQRIETSTTRADYIAKPPSHTISHKPPITSGQTGPFEATSTYRAMFKGTEAPTFSHAFVRPAPPQSQYKTSMSASTTTRASYNTSMLGQPSVSYAPEKIFTPTVAPLGRSTHQEFHIKFMLPGGNKNLRPAYIEPAYKTKVSAVTTTRMSYAAPPLTQAPPSKSYAPKVVYKPNLAPLGESTSRAEFTHGR